MINHPYPFLRTIIAASLCLPVQCVSAGYPDGRPEATLRMDARDAGIVLRHGGGPAECDVYGAREAIVFDHDGTYYLHYDGAGPKGWLACLATSKDLVHWEKKGAVLELGVEGKMDSAAASSPWVFHDGSVWHMFYLGTPNASPAPERVPAFPYLTMKARSDSPAGPWIKQYGVNPFGTRPNTWRAATASPGHVLRHKDELLMFFSGSTHHPTVKRTLGLARTRDPDGPWTVTEDPILPPEEQIENSSIYFEPENNTWFLFTNHIGINDRGEEYTDAVWVYWSDDLESWNPRNKAVVLDSSNCKWSQRCIGMPSVIRFGKRLAMFYDAPGGESLSHMGRDIGLAWLDLPLVPPPGATP